MARNTPEGGPLDQSGHSSGGGNVAVFLTFVTVGCGYIILAKLKGIEAFYVTFVPVGIMVAYALLISLSRGLRLRDDQSGDNLYYMGFLFTLTSLGVSLYQFSANRAAEEIVQNFGIAIGSTIAGIGLRVIFNQMRRDPVEVEHTMRLELAEAARRVRRELDSSVVEFGYFRRTAQQSAVDSFSHMTEHFDEILAKLLASLEAVTAKLSMPLEAAARQLGDATGEATRRGATPPAGRCRPRPTSPAGRRGGGALDEVVGSAMQTPTGFAAPRADVAGSHPGPTASARIPLRRAGGHRRSRDQHRGRSIDRPGRRVAAGYRPDRGREPRASNGRPPRSKPPRRC